MKNYFIIIFCSVLLTSCLFGDNPSSSNKLTEDFWLNWFNNNTDQHILFSTAEYGNIGSIVIESTVFAVGFNENFIIAKQHPNTANETMERIKLNPTITNYFIIDIRNYEKGNSNSYDVHKMNKNGFSIMRKHLGVPDDLDYTIINSELE